jgi:hypothetical protein
LGFNEGEGAWYFLRFMELSSESIQAQFRLTAQRLGQLRDRKDAQGRLIGKDISILLQQGNETLARAKAQRLIQDEIMGNLLENLEMQIGVLLERFSELERCVYGCHNVQRSVLSVCGISQRKSEPLGRGGRLYDHLRGSSNRLKRWDTPASVLYLL